MVSRPAITRTRRAAVIAVDDGQMSAVSAITAVTSVWIAPSTFARSNRSSEVSGPAPASCARSLPSEPNRPFCIRALTSSPPLGLTPSLSLCVSARNSGSFIVAMNAARSRLSSRSGTPGEAAKGRPNTCWLTMSSATLRFSAGDIFPDRREADLSHRFARLDTGLNDQLCKRCAVPLRAFAL